MTKLITLRSQLSSLRRARAVARSLTAYAATGIAIVWALAAVLVLDVMFELEVPQRAVVLLLAVAAVVWAALRYTRPFLGEVETDEDMALMVERQQEIDSDLVAALQFESPNAATWGSLQLENAVIDYVANVGSGLNVFEGFNREQMVRRATIFGVSAAVLALAALIFPGYAQAFLNRLMLGGMHYPSATKIDRILVNHVPVLVREDHGSSPIDVKCAESRPIQFLIQCAGELPDEGRAELVSTGSTQAKTTVQLHKLSPDERLDLLKKGESRIREALQEKDFEVSPLWKSETVAVIQFDAPQAATELAAADSREQLTAIGDLVAAQIAAWPADQETTAIYSGELPRLIDAIEYKLFLGDAWTDSASIAMTPLPTVEPRFVPQPPEYAGSSNAVEETSQRQLSVLEGSSVKVAVECTNKKSLSAAWLVLKHKDGSRRYDLLKEDKEGFRWAMPSDKKSPFDNVVEELRYEVQVQDVDLLGLETPIRGVIRIKPDRPPTGSAEIVHRVVLPTAQPIVQYRATDDFGVAQVNLIAQVERPTPESEGPMSSESSTGSSSTAQTPSATESTAAERRVFPLLNGKPVLSGSLPLQSTYAVGLSQLNVSKGDRVKLTLEVVDYRGNSPDGKPRGETYLSDPLILEISDESGVLAAISEADERSEQRLTDIIKRQLGIGESP
jgi:hypothetical protein